MTAPETQNDDPQNQTQVPKMKDGVILGPDGKPCKVCSTAKAFMNKSKKAPGTSSTSTTSTTASTGPPSNPNKTLECPPDAEKLGRHTWTFLHTTAAYYPEKPTETQKRSMSSLFESLPNVYPCSYCADDLGHQMKSNPPDLSNGYALSQWLCNIHNGVNRRLGKPEFDCLRVFERWKDGPSDGSCD